MTNPGSEEPKMLRCPKCDKILEMDDIQNVTPPLVDHTITICSTCYNLSHDFTHEAKQAVFDHRAKLFGIEWEWNQACKNITASEIEKQKSLEAAKAKMIEEMIT